MGSHKRKYAFYYPARRIFLIMYQAKKKERKTQNTHTRNLLEFEKLNK